MARPGITLRVDANTEKVMDSVTATFIAAGFRRRATRTGAPIEFAYGSNVFTCFAEVVSEVIPVILLPRYWDKRRVMRVRIRTLEEGTSRTTVRIDVRFVGAKLFAVPLFLETARRAVAALRDAGWHVTEEPVTDSALEGH